MKIDALINTSLAYLASAALVNVLLKALGYGKPAIALAVAAVVATDVAAWFFRRRREGRAPIRFRIYLGALMSGLCLAESIALQVLLHWMTHPIATTSVAAIGTFVFPVVMFEGFRSRIGPGRNRSSR